MTYCKNLNHSKIVIKLQNVCNKWDNLTNIQGYQKLHGENNYNTMSINGTIFMMISLIGIILIVIAPFCCADEMAKPSYISEYDFVELTEQNFNNEVGKSPYLVMFYDSR